MAISAIETFITRRYTVVQRRHHQITRIHGIGALLIAPNGVARRMLTVCRNGFEDVSGCISESRDHDALHDAALVNAERLALRGIQVSRTQGCPCASRYQAVYRDIKAAQAHDADEDDCVIRAWTTAKRLAGCIGRIFVARRSTSSARGKAGQ